MTSLSRWLFRKALVPFVSARTAKQLVRWPAQAPRARLGAEGLENRDVAGSLIDGFLMAAAGGLSSEPLAVMAGAFGENAMLAAMSGDAAPLFVGLADAPVAPPAARDPAVGPANPVATAAEMPEPVGGAGWVTVAFGGFNSGMFSFADGPFGDGFLPAWAGVSIGGDAPGGTHGDPPSAGGGSGGDSGGESPAAGAAGQSGGEVGAGGDIAGGPSAVGGAPLPNVGGIEAGNPVGTGEIATPAEQTTGSGNSEAPLGLASDSGTTGLEELKADEPAAQPPPQRGMVMARSGGYQSGAYDIVPDTEDVRKNEEVGFDVTLADGITELTDETVEWDFDYDGVTFDPEPDYEDAWAYFTFDAVGSRTVAARVTDAEENVEIVTEPITVGNPRPVVTSEDMEVTQGVEFPFAVDIQSEAAITSIEWAFWSDEAEEYEVDAELTALTMANPTYWFDNYGDAWVRVRATDANGEVGEAEFNVWIENAAPDGTVTYTDMYGVANGPIEEGETVTFTITDLGKELDVDNTDSFDVYADFDGSGEFVMIDEWEWTYDAVAQSISFDHLYDDNGPDGKPFAAKIRVSDDWGYETEDGVSVTVTNVAPTGTPKAGYKFATPETSGQEVWALRTGEYLMFEGIVEPSAADLAGLEYIWQVRQVGATGWTEIRTGDPAVSLDPFEVGQVLEVRPSLRDKDGAETKYATFKVATFPDKDGAVKVAPVEGDGFVVVPAFAGDPLSDKQDKDLALGNGPFGLLPLDGRPTNRPFLPGVYGTFLPAGVSAPPPSYMPFAQLPAVLVKDMANTAVLAPTFQLDAASVAFANTNGATVRYRVLVTVHELVYTTDTEGNPGAQYTLIDTLPVVVTTGVAPGTAFTVSVPSVTAANRLVSVTILPELMKDGAVFREAPAYQVIGSTPLVPPPPPAAEEPGFWQKIKDIWRIVKEVAVQFGEAVQNVFWAVVDGDVTFGQLWDNFSGGFKGAINKFFDDLKGDVNSGPGTGQASLLLRKFYEFLGGSGMANFNWETFNPKDETQLLGFLFSYSGLTWGDIQEVILDELGNGNVAGLSELVEGVLRTVDPVTGAVTYPDPDATDPAALVQFLRTLASKATEVGFTFDWAALTGELVAKVGGEVQDAIARAVPQALAMFVPGAGMVRALYRGLNWLLDNRERLGEVFAGIANSLTTVTQSAAAFEGSLLGVMRNGAGLMVSFLASQLGLDKLRNALATAVTAIPKKVKDLVRNAVRGYAKKTDGGTAVKERNSSQTANKTPSGQVTDVFTFGGTEYRLVVAGQSRGGTEIKIVEKATGKLVGEPLKEKHFTTADAKAKFNALFAAADALRRAAKKPAMNSTAPRPKLADLRVAQADVNTKRGTLLNIIDKCSLLNAGCFAAGTRLATPDGFRAIETIRPGERVLSRDQWDEAGEIAAKIVEEVFERYSVVLNIVADGREIRTTSEHPFKVKGKGWTAANELRVGDRLVCAETGKTATVESVTDTGERELVYNLRVAEYHTYFVGGEDWGFAVWVHNAYQVGNNSADDKRTMDTVLEKLKTDLNGVLSNDGKWKSKFHTLDMTKANWQSFQTTLAQPEERMATNKSYLYFVIDGAAGTPANLRVVKVGKTGTGSTGDYAWPERFGNKEGNYRYTAVLGAKWWIAAFEIPEGQTAEGLEKQCRLKLWVKKQSGHHEYWLPGDASTDPFPSPPSVLGVKFRPAKATLPDDDPYGQAVRRTGPTNPVASTFDVTAALAGTALANTPRAFEIDLNTKGAKDALKAAEGQYIYLLEERQATVSSVRKILKVGRTDEPADRMKDYPFYARYLGSAPFGYRPSGITAHLFQVDDILAARRQTNASFELVDLEHEIRLSLYNPTAPRPPYYLPLDHSQTPPSSILTENQQPETHWRTASADNFALSEYNG